MSVPQLTLSRKQIQGFSAFLAENKIKKWFVAKDQGAYVGAVKALRNGELARKIFYFRGCDPNRDDDFRLTAFHKFGGDDFGFFYDARIVHDIAKNSALLRVIVGPTQIEIQRR